METSLLSHHSVAFQANAAFSIGGRSIIPGRATRASMRSSCPPSASSAASNFYQVLALEYSENVGADAIKRAYRGMALQHHPDVCPAAGKAEATRRFIEINKAYETLSNPVLRERYDYQLELAAAAAAAAERGVLRRAAYPREVWMAQLEELKARSSMRKKRTNQ